MKTIFRSNNKTGNFTCISNSILQSETLTPDEIGVLVRLVSLPENFVINKTSIWKTMNIGRDHFNKVWQKLVEYGYIQTTKTLNKKTKGYEYTHTVHEVPFNQSSVNGSSVNGSSVHWKSVNGKSVNGKPVSIIIDNEKETEKIHIEEKEEKQKPEEKSSGPDIIKESKKNPQSEKTGPDTGPSVLGKNPVVDVSSILTKEVFNSTESFSNTKNEIPPTRNDLNYNERRRIEHEGMLLSSYYNKLTDIQQIEFFQLDYEKKLELATNNFIPTEEISTIGK
jgi:hypothetical protein